LQEIGQAMYANQPQEGAPNAGASQTPPTNNSNASGDKGKVVDADFEVVDDGKKQ
jgi:hypothetical protein